LDFRKQRIYALVEGEEIQGRLGDSLQVQPHRLFPMLPPYGQHAVWNRNEGRSRAGEGNSKGSRSCGQAQHTQLTGLQIFQEDGRGIDPPGHYGDPFQKPAGFEMGSRGEVEDSGGIFGPFEVLAYAHHGDRQPLSIRGKGVVEEVPI
jgi:hypothetical protein